MKSKSLLARREFMQSAAGVFALASFHQALAGGHSEPAALSADQNHAHHHDHEKTLSSQDSKHLAIMLKCIDDSEICLAHCYQQLAAGNSKLTECAMRASETISLCQALRQQILHHSATTVAVAKATAAVCKACAAECDIHKHHAQCKECGDSCKQCIKACQTIIDA